MTLSPEEQSFITQCRQRMVAKEPVSLDDMKRAIIILRQNRTAALDANASSGKKASKAKPTEAAVAGLLDDLEGM
jgi:hypothetical protein